MTEVELWLISIIALPVIGALFSLLMPGDDRLALRQIGMASSVASGLVSLWVAAHAFDAPWSARVLDVPLRVDGVGALVLACIGFGAPIALRAGAPRVQERSQFYVATTLFAHGLLVSAVLVEAPLLRLSLAALASVPWFALVALFGGPQRGTTSYRAALIWIGVDLAALAVVALLAARAGAYAGEASTSALARGFATLDADARMAAAIVLAGPALLRFAAGPFSVWLQAFLDEAPVSAAMLAAMGAAPLGALLFVDVTLPAAPHGLEALRTPIEWIAAGAALLAGVIVIAERDLRRMTAQLTFLAAATATPALVAQNAAGLAAGVLHVVAAGVSVALVLGVTEAIERRFETRDASALVGMSTSAPLLAALLALGLLALVGVPALGAGGSTWIALVALVDGASTAEARHAASAPATLFLAGALVLAHLLAAAGVVATLRRVFAPPTARGRRDLVRVTFAQGARLFVPALLMIAVGLSATRLASWADGAARDRAAHLERAARAAKGTP